jgi:hypothetical protein
MKSKNWCELNKGKQFLFIFSIVFLALGIGLAIKEIVLGSSMTIIDGYTKCELTFNTRTQLLQDITCPDENSLYLMNISGKITKDYTIEDYAKLLEQNIQNKNKKVYPDFNLTTQITIIEKKEYS